MSKKTAFCKDNDDTRAKAIAAMKTIVLFNKPYGVLTQFTGEGQTLADYIPIKDIYAVGRLDKDSEGLLVLTNDGKLQHQLSSPKHKLPKTYWVQVENIPLESALHQLRQGVLLADGATLPAHVERMEAPDIGPRIPPIRQRAQIPTCWLKIALIEGRNRQVRRMTAAIGHPTLRLIRYAIGEWTIAGLAPGSWRKL
jgi:23S rRNA pseudouridine2457 synthase